MTKALVRAFRWRKLLETRVYGTIDGLATAEKIDPSYVSRILRLPLLAPDIEGNPRWPSVGQGDAGGVDQGAASVRASSFEQFFAHNNAKC
jgi:hypothetical protein